MLNFDVIEIDLIALYTYIALWGSGFGPQINYTSGLFQKISPAARISEIN